MPYWDSICSQVCDEEQDQDTEPSNPLMKIYQQFTTKTNDSLLKPVEVVVPVDQADQGENPETSPTPKSKLLQGYAIDYFTGGIK